MPATKKPRYYRMTPGSVTRYFYVETYYFKTVEDRETFFEWINTHPEGTIKAKSDRAVRLTNYTCQVQRGEEIQFDINEMQLYNNQLKFVEGLYRRLS
jgi:hypothetical protein